ncbi:tumor necrosis factor receptor superfamily member 4 [Siphateles boraxobius]|uniref:tumor necrosis factor receptor superfamily member 4 n=1 Tax=Siphateles boraxobius TaxID=180520 RepID=UPI004064B077
MAEGRRIKEEGISRCSKMLALLIVLLLSSHVLPLVQSLTCDESTEYLENEKCCKKCEPGQSMVMRCGTSSSDTQCDTCGTGFYIDVYNENFNCHYCTMCTKEHMKYEKNCTPKSDAVCTCDEGYKCIDSNCEMCVKVQTYTLSPRPAFTRPLLHTQNMHDHVDGSCQHQPVSATIIHINKTAEVNRLWSSEKSNSGSSQCTEEEEVPMPVQEVCGKTEKLEDV